MCGTKFELHDTFADWCFEKQIGYGSIHDGEIFKLDLCYGCFDNLTYVLNIACKHNILN